MYYEYISFVIVLCAFGENELLVCVCLCLFVKSAYKAKIYKVFFVFKSGFYCIELITGDNYQKMLAANF